MSPDLALQARTTDAMPAMTQVEGHDVPVAPRAVDETGVPPEFLGDLVLKTVYVAPHFTVDWVSQLTMMSRSLIGELLEQLMMDRLVEVVGQDGPLSYRWAITDKGRQRAAGLLEINGYVGPAPVSLEAYTQMINWQCERLPDATPEDVARVTADIVLPDQAVEVVGLAALSRRSLFLYGPPGNGKTTVAHLLHDALEGQLWVPHAILVGNNVIRVYDPQVHEPETLELNEESQRQLDRRWVRIRRPFVVGAGELQIDDLDLAYSPALGYYEAPMPMKANGGIFLLDDFGYQRDNPFQLLNRWVFPLENGIDFLTLKNGQKLFVPFRQMLIISTNLDPAKVMEPAILRRMGYRLYLDNPTPELYREIIGRVARQHNIEMPAELIDHLLQRYDREERPLRGCEPRDLLHRVRDICRYRGLALQVDQELLDVAWSGYFGRKLQ